MVYTVIRVFLKFLLAIIAPAKVIGMENMKKAKGAYIISCNHQTYIDVVQMIAKLPRSLNFMAKEELLKKNRFLGWFFGKMHVFPVRRGTADLAAIKRSVELLKSGEVLCIFPQGTRVKDNPFLERSKMFGGPAMVAMRAQVHILPMMFTAPPMLFHKSTLLIGPMLDLSDFFKEKMTGETVDKITDLLTEKMNGLLQEYQEKEAAVQ